MIGALGNVMTDTQLIGAGPVTAIDLVDSVHELGRSAVRLHQNMGSTRTRRQSTTSLRMMPAVVFLKPGPPDVLAVIDLPLPEAGAREGAGSSGFLR